MIKLVREEHCVTRNATISDPLRISAAWTMVWTKGISGSEEIGPEGTSVGSTEWGKVGGDVMPSRTSFTCGRMRLDVFSEMDRFGPRFPFREARWMYDVFLDDDFILCCCCCGSDV